MTRPTPPIELAGSTSRWGEPDPLPDGLADALAAVCTTTLAVDEVAEASRDWWPLALHWALAGEVPQAGCARLPVPPPPTRSPPCCASCHAARVPVTAAGGRSGVCGGIGPRRRRCAARPHRPRRVGPVDAVVGWSRWVAGTFGPDLERVLNTHHGLTVGHFPQSFDLATVGGWVACRGAGQYSTRYGKIEDMVVGLEVVLADGRTSARAVRRRPRSGPTSPSSSSGPRARSG
jgi:alkyldihydroxyacetonephosphate synthase